MYFKGGMGAEAIRDLLDAIDLPQELSLIHILVEEALDPEEVDAAIIVTSPGKPELLSYFQPDRSLEALLRERGKAGSVSYTHLSHRDVQVREVSASAGERV